MKKNVGKMDRIFRLAISVSLAILAYARIIPANLVITVYLIALVIALTAVFRICFIYKLFKISTLREKDPFKS